MRDAGFGAVGGKVEDGGARGFGARAGGGGDRDQWLEGFCNGLAGAEGSIDEVEERGRRKRGVEVHEFRSVDHRTAADGEECGRLVPFGKRNSVFDGGVFGLDTDVRIDFVGDVLGPEGFEGLFHRGQARHVLVGDDADASCGEVLEVHPHFFGAPRTEADARGSHFEGVFSLP